MRHIYKLESGETECYSAESEEQLISMVMEEWSDNADEIKSCIITVLPDDEVIRVYQEWPFCDPSPFIEQTCRQWADEIEGLVCSTEG